jgi:hypothetical protein
MAAAREMFHNELMAREKERVALRIQQGTKASSPQLLAARYARHDFKGLPDNSTGSKNRPFFITPDQSDKVLPAAQAPPAFRGGVLRDYKYARFILDRRAKDSARQDMEAQGITPPAPAMLELSAEESRSLELNTLLQLLQDAVETGELADLTNLVPDLKNILRIFVSLLPTFNERKLTDFQDFFQELAGDLDAMLGSMEGTRRTTSVPQALRFAQNIYKLISRYAPYVNASDKDKQTAIRIFLKETFKLQPSELVARPGVLGQRAAAEMAGEEEGEEEVSTTVEGAPAMFGEDTGELVQATSLALQDATLEQLDEIYNYVMERPRAQEGRTEGQYRAAIRRRLPALDTETLSSVLGFLQ